jgi:hypothetical protein
MDWLHFFMAGRGVPLMLYAAFQIGALVTLRGRWRIAVSAPLLLALLICGNMAWAYPGGHNVWLMIMLIVAPGAVLAILLIWVTEAVCCRRAVSAAGLAITSALAAWAATSGQHEYGILWRAEWTIGWTIATACALLGLGLVTSQLRR